LISHGYVYKKRARGKQEAVGKRVFCSNRHWRTGCGRTMQLYLDTTLRYGHHAGERVSVFVLSLQKKCSIDYAYREATGAATGRHGYRWLARLEERLGVYRSRFHRPCLEQPDGEEIHFSSLRRSLLASTFRWFAEQFGEGLCQAYQSQWQEPFF
jgi:hypothetical protein